MEYEIVELAIQTLTDAGIHTIEAYPARRYLQITEAVAAVHLKKVDRQARSVTLEILVYVPATLGGTACEREALKVTSAISALGADCVQSGCEYDSMARLYSTKVTACFADVIGSDSCELGLDFTVKINGVEARYAVSFSTACEIDTAGFSEIGEDTPAYYRQGENTWTLTLEEEFPAGASEDAQDTADFTLTLVRRDGSTDTYSGCYWLSDKKTYTSSGIHRVRVGIATSKAGA